MLRLWQIDKGRPGLYERQSIDYFFLLQVFVLHIKGISGCSMKRLLSLFLLLLVLAPAPGRAEESGFSMDMLAGFNAGIGGTMITSEYKGMSSGGTFLPLIGYEGEYLYLRGLAGGVHLYRNGWLEFNVQLSYLPQHFYADNSDSWAMRRLDDRYSSMLAGVNARITSPWGILSLTGSADVLGYSNGVLLDGNYSLPLPIGPVMLVPTVGVQWADVNYNDYYYGVSASEARKSGLHTYDPESSFTPYAQLTAKMDFTEHWSAFASCRAMFLTSEVTDSPMVEDSEKYAISLGVMYGF